MSPAIHLGTCVQQPNRLDREVEGDDVEIAGERFNCIRDVDAESAQFPYATHDKLIENAATTGNTLATTALQATMSNLFDEFFDVATVASGGRTSLHPIFTPPPKGALP